MSRRPRHNWDPSSIRAQQGRTARRQTAAGANLFHRRLRIEPLEERRLLATVNTLSDVIDDDDGLTTLREAILTASSGETIDFDASFMSSGPATIELSNFGHDGQILINKNLTIQGPGAKLLTIKAFDPDNNDDGDGSRVFYINAPGLANVTISGLTLTNGDVNGSGGAIASSENLTVRDSVITDNSGSHASSRGGGIAQFFGSLTIERTTISENAAIVSGGGVYVDHGTLRVIDSTISGNVSFGSGGGIYGYYAHSMTVTGSTFSGNTAFNAGGGFGLYNSALTVRHSTITANRADADGNGSGGGGGIVGTSSSTFLDQSIVAANQNAAGGFTDDDIFGTVTARYSLVGTNVHTSLVEAPVGSPDANGNLIGGPINGTINPSLSPLGDYGGARQTHVPLASSPALDAGDPAAVAGVGSVPLNDQRGSPFARVFDGDGAGGARIDIGATERQTLPGLNLIVDEVLDENDGDYSLGDLSLREAIGLANGSPGANTITFAPSLYSIKIAKIFLTQGEFVINDSLTINGPGSENLLIDASKVDPTPYVRNGDGIRVFFLRDRTSFVPINVALVGMSIRGADVNGSGGAINNSGENLIVTNCEIEFNHADNGGAIFVSNGTLAVNGSKVSGNSASNHGGGVYLYEARPSTITDSTLSENVADANGGGIRVGFSDTLTITRSTISVNAANNGGGISGGDLVINESAITGNSATSSGGGIRVTGALAVNRSTISGNSAVIGGGIRSDAAVTITDSILSENVAQYGGGVFQNTYELTITGSTISGNDASQAGGGLISATSGSFKTTILNSTFADNTATTLGGAIFNSSGRVDILHSTITAPIAFNPGGGVASRGNNSTETRVFSSIIANNHGADVQLFDGATNSFVSQGYNLVGFGNATAAFTNAGDQVGVDPMLAFLLEDHGGLTKTYVPLPGSPVIDAGPPASTVGLPFFDQRGFPFIRAFNGDGILGTQVDIGAFEVQTVSNLTLMVDTLADEYDGNFSAGDFSLREAIGLANGSAGPNTITFAPALTGGGPATVLLTRGEFQIVETLTITGAGAALLSIDASGNDPTPTENNGDGSRIFSVDDTIADETSIVFTLNGLTLTGADEHTSGGAIDSEKTLVLNNCTITGNAAADGGGINVDDGTLTLNNSTVVGNHARDDGGGIFEDDGTTFINSSVVHGNTAVDRGGGMVNLEKVVITASTISGNSAAVGGGIFSQTNFYGTEYTTISNSTISGNSATNRGGGVYSVEGITTIRFSTITDNNAPNGMGSGLASHGNADTRTEVHSSVIAANDQSDVDFVNGGANSFDSEGYNLIGAGNATMSPLNAFNQTGDQVGANPMLGPLAANGGQTMTHALLVGSPAIDTGDPAAAAGVGNVPQFDQRGAPLSRVFNGDGVGGARIDKGAFELQPVVPALTGDYNLNGMVDAADYVVWRNTLTNNVVPFSGADGDGDGVVDQGDYGVWRARFGQTLGTGSGADAATAAAEQAALDAQTVLPEPLAPAEANAQQISASLHSSAADQAADPRGANAELLDRRPAPRTSYRPAFRPSFGAEPAVAASRRDVELMAWLAAQPDTKRRSDVEEVNTWKNEDKSNMRDWNVDYVDEVFALLISG